MEKELERIVRWARRHGLVINNLAWCSSAGCIQIEAIYDEEEHEEQLIINIETGDVEDALKDIERTLRELDNLEEKAKLGGHYDISKYVRAVCKAKQQIQYYAKLLKIFETGEGCEDIIVA